MSEHPRGDRRRIALPATWTALAVMLAALLILHHGMLFGEWSALKLAYTFLEFAAFACCAAA
jgi:hypothetical protein